MLIEVIQDNKFAPEGTVGVLVRENKNSYRIQTSFLACTFEATVPKKYCEICKDGKPRHQKRLENMINRYYRKNGQGFQS